MENKSGKKSKAGHNSKSQKPAGAVKKSSKKLETHPEIYSILIENSTDGLSVIQDRVITFANQRLADMSGYSVEELTGMPVFNLVPPDLVAQLAARLLQHEQQVPVPEIFYSKLLCRDGKVKEMENTSRIIQFEGQPTIIAVTRDITQRRQIESKILKSEKFFKEITENSSDIIIITDEKGIIKYCSPSMERFAGYKPDDVVGTNAFGYMHPEDMKRAVEEYAEAITKNDSLLPPNSFRIIHKDGSIRYFSGTGKMLLDNPDVRGVVMNVHDVTEHRRAENCLQESEDRYRLLAENLTDVIFTIDMNFNYTYASPSVYNLVGYTADEMMALKVDNLVDADTLNWFVEMFAEEMEIEKRPDRDLKRSRVLEYQHLRKDGSRVWVENKITFLRDQDSITLGIIGTVRDITERKRAEEQVRKEIDFTRSVLDSLTMPFFMFDATHMHFFRWNKTFAAVSGYSDDEIVRLRPSDLIPQNQREVLLRRLEEFKLTEHISFEMPVLSKNGNITPYLLSGNLLHYEGKPYVVGMGIDITKRKKTEDSLRQSEEKYRTLLENMEEGYFEIDLVGNFTFFNDTTCLHLGYSREELMGINNHQYMDEQTAEKLSHIFKKIYETDPPVTNLEWQIIRKDGSTRQIEGSISLLKDISGLPKGFRGIARDITGRKQSEELLRQSEEKYRLLADNMKEYVWLMDLDLKINYISPSVEKLMRYTLDDFQKLPLDKILTAASFKAAMDFFAAEMPKAMEAPPDYLLDRSLELEFYCKDGRPVWGECNFSFIRDERGKPLSILGVSRNINERKQMEDALRKSEENFRRSLDDSPLGVRISTMEGKTLYANRAILDMYGYEKIEELENTPLQERYTPESYAEFKERKRKRLQGEFGPSEYEISIVRKDGEIRHLHVFRKEIFWNGQRQSQVIYEDITLRRRAEDRLNETLESLRQSIKITIQVLGTASEAKDPYMAGHQRRVADLARAIATEMKLPHEKIEAIRMASAIHDIGKISVPAEILCKPAILNDLEFSLVKNHPRYSYDIIKELESPWPLADIVHQHHERVDGSGYPLGLRNGEILIESRILAVADVVEAMISYRPYRPALALNIALAEIESNAGILYDRDVVEACLRLFREKNYRIA